MVFFVKNEFEIKRKSTIGINVMVDYREKHQENLVRVYMNRQILRKDSTEKRKALLARSVAQEVKK